jgi:hypothetical protein
MAEDSISLQWAVIDGELRDMNWARWQRQSAPGAQELAAAARAWCASAYWDRNTPNLEDWAVVVDNLKSQILSEADLAQMMRPGPYRISFPPIPFFEMRQVKDLLGITDELGAALLAEQLMGLDSLLTVGPEDALRLCRERIESLQPKRMDYAAWCWLIGPDCLPPQQRAWPTEAGIRALWGVTGPRGAQARAMLEEAALTGGDAGAQGVLAVLAKLRREEERSRAASEPVRVGPAKVVRVELEQAKTEAAGAEQGASEAQAGAEPVKDPAEALYERLCDQLFRGPVEMKTWEALAQQIGEWAQAGRANHPLTGMIRYLRAQYFPAEGDDLAWKNLEVVFGKVDGMMRAEGTGDLLPLLALELAACVRSTVCIGEVALGVVAAAGEQRLESKWWKALRAGLQEPMERRGSWYCADDRMGLARDAVVAQAQWLSPPEASAFNLGFVVESAS